MSTDLTLGSCYTGNAGGPLELHNTLNSNGIFRSTPGTDYLYNTTGVCTEHYLYNTTVVRVDMIEELSFIF